MERRRFFLGFLALLLLACNGQGDRVRRFIPGIFARAVSGEMSRASDTLVITLAGGNNYRIERHTGYQWILRGKLSRVHLRHQVLAARFDEQRQVLLELRKGLQFSFAPDQGMLVVNGNGVYQKVK